MNLSQYIEKIGDEEAAKRFRVKKRTAASWRRGERKPLPDKMKEIIKASKGELSSYESAYGHSKEARA